MGTWNRVFAIAYDPFLWWAERRGMAALRRTLLAEAEGRVLEIGAGTGLNLEHYGPAVAEIELLEPDALLHPRLRRRLAAAEVRGSITTSGAEALPFPDASFDAVVSTLVLCTVPDPAAAVAEIVRVLRPGGRFFFIEHVRGIEGSRTAAWQARLHRAWHAFACGCHANRDTRRLIDASPLHVGDVTEGRWRGMPPIVHPLIVGTATRSSAPV
ncbi:MAG TPA: class I SAM-dependent methyltransferase [Gaiellaceae bacterium]|nr:class I SAM-dependent methyltransferase [Gaiellaceae bacterium]